MIVALAQMLVLLTRNIDLSVASVIGLSAYGAARFMHLHPQSPVLAGIGVAAAIGLACGGFNGVVVTLGRIPAIVVTLGTLSVFRGLNSLWAGGKQISADQVPQSWLDLTSSRILGVPAVVLIAIATLIVVGDGVASPPVRTRALRGRIESGWRRPDRDSCEDAGARRLHARRPPGGF